MAKMDEKQQEVKQESKQDRTWAMLCHLGSLAGFVILFGHIIAPLVIWLVKKEELPLVEDQGKESLNFQISMTIYLLVTLILIPILIGGWVLMIGLVIFDIVMIIKASVKANNGEKFRYPLCIRFIK